MDSAENSVNHEVAAEAVERHEKTPQESFGELRKAKEDLERQLWQAKQEKEFYEKQFNAKSQPQSQPEEEFDFRTLEQEEFPDGKKIAKAFGAFNRKIASNEQKLIEKDNQLRAMQLAIENADFKEIVTPENIEKYIKSDEDNVESVQKASDPLRKAYNLIKKSAAYQADRRAKEPKSISQEQQRVDEKEAKPKTTSIGVRSEAVTVAAKLSNSTMTKEQRLALWKDTQAASRR